MPNILLNSNQLDALHQLIDQVADRQRRDFGQISSDEKPDGTLITSCDNWSDATLVSGLSRIAPGEGVLSEEGLQLVPDSETYWVVDPLDGTTNFVAGIPYWAISVARISKGRPSEVFLDAPALNQRIIAIRGRGVWINGKPLKFGSRLLAKSSCISLCSRSIRILQRRPDHPFPGKIRVIGASSLNLVSVALGQTIAALEATPKIWDLAAAWLVLEEVGCPIRWLDKDPSVLTVGHDLAQVSFPMVAAASLSQLDQLLNWTDSLHQH